MKTWVHSVVSIVLTVILYPIFGWKVLFIFAGGVLIDIDHYFWYIYKHKHFSLLACYRYYIVDSRKDNFKQLIGILLIFHTVEFLLVMTFLSFYSELALMFTIGLLSHYFLDLIFFYSVTKRLITNHSIIWWIIKNKIQKV